MAKKNKLENEEIKEDELMEEEDLDLEDDEVDVDDEINEDEEEDIEDDDDEIDEEEETEDDEEELEEDDKELSKLTDSQKKAMEKIIAARTSQIKKSIQKNKPKVKKSKTNETSNEEILQELQALRQENKLNKFTSDAQSAGVDPVIINSILQVSDIDKLEELDLKELASRSKKITNVSTTKPSKNRVKGTKKLEKGMDSAFDDVFGED